MIKQFITYIIAICIFSSFGLEAQDLVKISIGHDGNEANGNSAYPHVSGNGKYVCYESTASNLVSNDLNGVDDIFVWRKSNGETTRISVNSDGVEANGVSLSCVMSKSGRYIAFSTASTNLVAEDTTSAYDAVIIDTKRNIRELISITTSNTGGNDSSYPVSISDNGRYVLFFSDASDLIDSDTNGERDVFLRDRRLGTTTLISKNDAGVQSDGSSYAETYHAMSSDNRYITYYSQASNIHSSATPALVTQGYLYDRRKNKTKLIAVDKNNSPLNTNASRMMLSRDSKQIVYAAYDSTDSLADNDNNSFYDTYQRNRKSSAVKLVSQNEDRIVGAGGFTVPRGITQTGRYILMRTFANNLLPTSTDSSFAQIILKDRIRNQYLHVTVNSSNEAGNADSIGATVSMTGKTVAFDSLSSNLATPDDGLYRDIFIRSMSVTKDSL